MLGENETVELQLADDISSPLSQDAASYQYFKGLNERRLIVNGEITEALVEQAIVPLVEMAKTDEPIELYLSTTGGMVSYAFALAAVIDRIKCPLTTYLVGDVWSAGMYIAMAGYDNPCVHKIAYPFTEGLLHDGRITIAEMPQYLMDDMVEHDRRCRERTRDYVLTHSRITGDEYDKMIRSDFWLLPEQMWTYGIVDGIL